MPVGNPDNRSRFANNTLRTNHAKLQTIWFSSFRGEYLKRYKPKVCQKGAITLISLYGFSRNLAQKAKKKTRQIVVVTPIFLTRFS